MKSQVKLLKKIFLLLFVTFIISSCSSSGSSSSSIVISSPKSVEITAKHEEFTVQFSKIAGIGSSGFEVLPYFEVYINTQDNILSAEKIGEVQQQNDGSGLMRQFIKPKKTSSDGENIVLEYPIKDGTEYFVWIRACYAGYGCSSNYAKTSATPVPYPSKLTSDNVKLINGESSALIKIINASRFDEYGILTGADCSSEKLPKFDPKYNTPNDNFLITGLVNGESYPVCIRAQNINTDKNNPETISWLQLGNAQPVISTASPVAPEISLVSEGNKRITIAWTGDFEGADAVKSYEVVYSSVNGEKKENVSVNNTNIEYTILQLENNVEYSIKVRALNSAGSAESNTIKAAAKEGEKIDFNNLDTVLGKSAGRFIYAEDVPHSDFWRIDSKNPKGGRSNSDRLVRGKETALGNLFTDGIYWYVTEKLGISADFAVLAGEMISNGIDIDTQITPRFLMGITDVNYINDSLVLLTIKGKYLINEAVDYNIDLNNYPALDGTGSAAGKTLFGQAASVYRNGHYGTGAGVSSYATKAWLIPSKHVKYTIEYLPYDIKAFENNFNSKCANVGADYDSVKDEMGCYLYAYADTADYYSTKWGYKRGRIKSGSLLINGKEIEPEKEYKIITTKRLADTMYIAFLDASAVTNLNVIFWQAVGEYIYNQGKIEPYLDGRIKLEGGVPGNTANDFK